MRRTKGQENTFPDLLRRRHCSKGSLILDRQKADDDLAFSQDTSRDLTRTQRFRYLPRAGQLREEQDPSQGLRSSTLESRQPRPCDEYLSKIVAATFSTS